MGFLNERINAIIREKGMTKTAFADRINVSQAFVSQICSGASQPSERTIADICREFNVNEEWLRTGKGEMFIEQTKDEQIAAFVGSILKDEDDSFKRRLISGLAALDDNGWEVLEKFLDSIQKEKD